MIFTEEGRLLKYTFDDYEKLDKMTICMFEHNKINGFLDFSIKNQTVVFNTGELTSLGDLIVKPMSIEMAFKIVRSISDIIFELNEFMLNENIILFNIQNIYVDVNKELVYLAFQPYIVNTQNDFIKFLKIFFLKLITKDGGDNLYVTRVLDYLERESLDLNDFSKFLSKLLKRDGQAQSYEFKQAKQDLDFVVKSSPKLSLGTRKEENNLILTHNGKKLEFGTGVADLSNEEQSSDDTVYLPATEDFDEASKPYLVNAKTKEETLINKNDFKIGRRRKEVDFAILNNTAISGIHAIISKSGANSYLITDNNSTNFTFLENNKLEPGVSYNLTSGMKILFASEEFYFLLKR